MICIAVRGRETVVFRRKTGLVACVNRGYHPRMVRPLPHSVPSAAGHRRIVALLIWLITSSTFWVTGLATAQDGPSAERPVTVRVTWGGGKARAWSGSIRLIPAEHDADRSEELLWQTLCVDADAAATAHSVGGTIFIHEPLRRGGNGIDLEIPRWRGARIEVRLFADGDERSGTTLEAAVADVMLDVRQQSLDRDGNRLSLKTAPGDGLRVALINAATMSSAVTTEARRMTESASAIFRPQEIVRLTIDPLLPKRSPGTAAVELRMRLKAAAEAEPLVVQSVPLKETVVPAADSRLQLFERIRLEVPLPSREGAYDIELEAVERGGLRWSRPLASRTVQVVAIADAAPNAVTPVSGKGVDATETWKVIHELDPGSPRLHERLRRLPAAGMAYVPMPAMPMPSMSLPSVTVPGVPLPHVSMPNVPMPKLPNVPLPSVSSIVPKLSGLLAAGHSTVEAHPLGPMLRLPPARSAEEPAWEGIAIVNAQPGMPHLVEVEFPRDQQAVVGVSVLETDAVAASVEVRSSGGFEVTPPAAGISGSAATVGGAGLGRHAFVFWPTTRHPLILISNPSPRGAALFGRVRVSAGPLRPPAKVVDGVAGRFAASVGPGRRTYAYLPAPDFSHFGAPERPASGAGRPFADWKTFLAGATHATEWFSAQGAAGAMVVVYRDGAAIWPSRLTRGAPRWDSGAITEANLDPIRKDLLGMLCRMHAREGQRFVPALSFDAPMPALETVLAGGGAEAVGIACVGRDGRPKQTSRGRGCHYNVLDPRVQEAVEDMVKEVAERVRDAEAVDGLAIVIPHDGWMHLPGTAWCLDDVTFQRFLRETGGQTAGLESAAGAERFARRAMLAEGPLRERWLAWRAQSIARFHARLAAVLSERGGKTSLYLVPTSLFTEGDLAVRFRPTLAAEPADADVLLEIGLDPGRLTADRRVVFVSPHVHSASDSLLERSMVENANRSLGLARGAANAARRGMVALEQPRLLSIGNVVPHAPFGNLAAASDTAPFHVVAESSFRCRPLAESLVASDVETVFDMGLAFCRVESEYDRCLRAFGALSGDALELVDPLPAPLVVRSRKDKGLTVVSVANAGPAPCRASLSLAGAPSAVIDAVDGTRLPLEPAGGAAVSLGPWEVRTLLLDGGVAVNGARIAYEEQIRQSIAARLADLARRRAVLETPRPLEALDNPGFELAGAADAAAGGAAAGGGLAGWELVETTRGAVAFVPGVDGGAGRGVGFSSKNGLSTLRSNPFPPPATGRVSVAVWLRIPEGDAQPPLRLALEGVQEGGEYYRFAPVGGLTGGKPLTSGWSQFVLQVDDLPVQGVESLRVRFDLLGPGVVEIDGVRVFGLAFDESQRVQLSRRLAIMEQRLAADDLGACLIELDTYWPRFLAAFVSDDAVAAMGEEPPRTRTAPTPGASSPVERSGSLLDRVRRWWQ